MQLGGSPTRWPFIKIRPPSLEVRIKTLQNKMQSNDDPKASKSKFLRITFFSGLCGALIGKTALRRALRNPL